MRKYIFSFFLCLLFIFVSSVPFLFAEESMTITTYYPSPYGNYQDLYVANELGVGTTDPGAKLDVYSELTGGAGGHANQPIIRITQGQNTSYNVGDIHGELQFYSKDTVQSGIVGGIQGYIRAVTTRGNGIAYADTGMVFGTSYSSTGVLDRMIIKGDGNVGIGTTTPTGLLEVACPDGFTNVKGGPANAQNQLGCMETDEHASGVAATWYVAVQNCFSSYGARLPIYSEWYLAMNNYALANEVDDWEWLGNSDHSGAPNRAAIAGSGVITTVTVADLTAAYPYRCWIPR